MADLTHNLHSSFEETVQMTDLTHNLHSSFEETVQMADLTHDLSILTLRKLFKWQT